jgi:hypothetical protein
VRNGKRNNISNDGKVQDTIIKDPNELLNLPPFSLSFHSPLLRLRYVPLLRLQNLFQFLNNEISHHETRSSLPTTHTMFPPPLEIQYVLSSTALQVGSRDGIQPNLAVAGS